MSFEPAALHSALLSDVGRTRSENQDACGEFQSADGARLVIVADGMGGHRGGATASRLVVESLEHAISGADGADGPLLERAIVDANARVQRASEADLELRGMGTTCVALLFAPGSSAWVAHVGDSRAYRWRDGGLEALTQDHSLVAELVRRGEITPEEAEVHPRRSEILRSVGAAPEVDVELQQIDVRPGDRYLLCSDGLSGVVSDAEIGAVLAAETPERAVRVLVDAANERGGPDNITVAITVVPDAAAASAGAPGTFSHASGDDLRHFEREFSDDVSRRRFRTIALAASIVATLLVLCIVLLLAMAQRTEAPPLASPTPPTQALPPAPEPPSQAMPSAQEPPLSR